MVISMYTLLCEISSSKCEAWGNNKGECNSLNPKLFLLYGETHYPNLVFHDRRKNSVIDYHWYNFEDRLVQTLHSFDRETGIKTKEMKI